MKSSSGNENLIPNAWDDNYANGFSQAQLLEYRSNLLGSDMRVTNFGGGNTSCKLLSDDPLTGEPCQVLWVKGSGGDIGSMDLSGFSTLYLDKLIRLKDLYRGEAYEDEMVDLLSHCTFNLNSRAASIDTPLHAYLPYKHVDHLHPDSVIAIAASANSEQLTQDIFDGDIGWLAWRRPGFQLGLELEKVARENPKLKGVILESHGLFTWAESSKECYELSLAIINKAQLWLDTQLTQVEAFGGAVIESLASDQRRLIASTLMPLIRGKTSAHQRQIGHFSDTTEVLEFVNSHELKPLANLGTSCPDHFLRTKIKPMVLDCSQETGGLEALVSNLDSLLEDYRADYEAYYNRCKNDNSPAIRDSNPVVYLIPGVGMITFAKDKATARIASEFYTNAINVMKGASGVGEYVGLDEQEAFDIEYWLLEEAKLQRMPKAKSLAGRVAFITGGAGGIGKATAGRLLQEGAAVILADIDEKSLEIAEKEFSQIFGDDVVRTVLMDVTSEDKVNSAFRFASLEFGGIDIVVSNAGIASSSPLDETSLENWEFNQKILSTGYFLVSKAAFSHMKSQSLGGAIIFVASKNGLVASANAAAYCTAKAAEIQLARCVALEGAPMGIRVNVVNPDAVLRGSKIWTGKWKEERASAYKMSTDDLEEHYRQRSLLKRNVFPEDIAEGVYFFAADISSKSTGNILNVDAGHAPSFTR
ncbi:bifunctional rhamnulose-1-phosphate aldolase/short-chain dehydrogenase [Alginatibacterium sediminis]|uniref:Bifunctional rhamnulose-1-phosphate aldolase/short-chain dehydrogenase n=1 Tax=Alginatibacterium sediminis TaxID=2164068 RepID=A0A420EB32_9ALTE|nr:bifunctional rhamnulose-1-phosphate aldolase/short-chain dehydrogenase [Alginatibacterium sediminis]RKF17864.1 bifunctional rhamnulose-1-phosphate aldolase/short-chain dehydrogenase [Alginatibacterium sediminis]